MALFTPNKRAKHRRFDYEPRYYNPKKEQDIKRRMRIKSKSQRRTSPAKAVWIAVLLLLALYIYTRF